ncbi:MAG: DUF4369 domain-containing protein [Arenibacter sp.]|uniref:DUF4369 domain-containing protein n=1 Tax=Arenibacter latericius TaxID=86104 RepID=UPI0003F8754C|nr:DUF4369 domain-containing protein [Arenibacter latericius]MDX1326060.1 DUF4369 domain-containing protein [Arenibacter sp.]
MKKIFITGLIAAFIASCAGTNENTMTVSGKVKGLKKGTLYLQHIVDTSLINIDSLIVKGDGNFSFATEIESPEIFYLYLDKKDNNDINDRIMFFGEPGEITINTAWNTFDLNPIIKGSESHDKLTEYQKVMSRFNTQNLQYIKTSLDPKAQNNQALMDSLQELSDKNVKRGYLFALNFAMNNTDSYIAPYIALKEVSDANIKYLDSINNTLSPEVANSKYGKELKQFISDQKSNQEK